MTTKPTSLSHLLIISLLSLSSCKTTATYINPLSIPSCSAHPALLKCAHDIQSIYTSIGSVESGNVAHTTSLILDSINSAKASYFNVLHFLSSHHIESEFIKSIHVDFNVAIHELNEASKVLNGKTKLSSSEQHKIQNFLKIAHRNVAQLIARVKHRDADIHVSLEHLINQSINLTVLSLKIVGELNGKIWIGN